MRKKINSLHIEPDSTAFGADDFRAWWTAGMSDNDELSEHDREELFENCMYIAEAENRAMLQTGEELREAIDHWADAWNRSINL